jgi:hypothetical protein
MRVRELVDMTEIMTELTAGRPGWGEMTDLEEGVATA